MPTNGCLLFYLFCLLVVEATGSSFIYESTSDARFIRPLTERSKRDVESTTLADPLHPEKNPDDVEIEQDNEVYSIIIKFLPLFF